MRGQHAIILAFVSLLPLCVQAQTPEDDRRIAWQLSINNSRPELLQTLAPKIMPTCVIRASEEDIASFFPYWREMARQIATDQKPRGVRLVSGNSLSPAEAANANAGTPWMVERAREQIETWKIYSCVARQFGATRFFAHYGFFGTPWPAEFPATFVEGPTTERSVIIPDMSSLEPLDALGRFFRTAKKQGLWAAEPDIEQYFFERYETDEFVNMERSGETDRWFATPPWLKPSDP